MEFIVLVWIYYRWEIEDENYWLFDFYEIKGENEINFLEIVLNCGIY